MEAAPCFSISQSTSCCMKPGAGTRRTSTTQHAKQTHAHSSCPRTWIGRCAWSALLGVDHGVTQGHAQGPHHVGEHKCGAPTHARHAMHQTRRVSSLDLICNGCAGVRTKQSKAVAQHANAQAPGSEETWQWVHSPKNFDAASKWHLMFSSTESLTGMRRYWKDSTRAKPCRAQQERIAQHNTHHPTRPTSYLETSSRIRTTRLVRE